MSGDDGDKTRLCPSCRMDISILATKCRHCGENVGRPKVEAHHLTVRDLGGETQTRYTPSGNVMEAIEAFRVDEDLGSSDSGLGDLDADFKQFQNSPEGQAGDLDPLAGSGPSFGSQATPSRPRRAVAATPPAKAPGSNIQLVVWCVVGVIACSACFVYVFPALYHLIFDEEPLQEVTYDNEAPDILAQADESLDLATILETDGVGLLALGKAVEALEHVDNEENQKILERCCQQLSREVSALLNADPWKRVYLEKASDLMNRAMKLDVGSEALRDMKKETLDEVYLYKTELKRIDVDEASGTRTATFAVMSPGSSYDIPRAEKQVIAGRFKITSILHSRTTKEVHFEDMSRKTARSGNRRLRITPFGEILPDS